MFLDREAEAGIKQRVARLEAATGVETVAAVVARSDSYPEIPWKAFALGASVSAGTAFAAALFDPRWAGVHAVMEIAVAVLAAGAAAALATLWMPRLARLFLVRARGQGEVLQIAHTMFLESGLFRTRRRHAVLLLASLFEREAIVLADPGLREQLGQAALQEVVAAVIARLARGELKEGLLDGLDRLQNSLVDHGFRPQPGETNEVSNAVIQRQGQ